MSIRASFLRRCLATRAESGQVIVLAALLFVVICGVTGLALDIGVAISQRRAAQNAADAAALAGANDLPGDALTAESDAISLAAANGFSTGGSVTVVANSPPSKGPHQNNSGAVEVVITKQVPTSFMRVLGIGSVPIKARSVALTKSTPGGPCAFCVLSPSTKDALQLQGNGSVTVVNGGVVVDSNNTEAVRLGGNGSITADFIGVVGGTKRGGNGTFNPPPTVVQPVPDPLAAVPVPSLSLPSKGSVTLSSNANMTIDPGIYDSITISGNGTLTLNPGIYVLRGMLDMSGNGDIVGNGVMLYFGCSAYPTPCSTGQQGGRPKLTGNGSYHLTAPTSGPYQGLAMFFDRKNTSTLELAGNGSDFFTGTIYAKSALLNLAGNGGVSQFNSLVIVDRADLQGNGDVQLNFDPNENYPVSSPPGQSNLVE